MIINVFQENCTAPEVIPTPEISHPDPEIISK